MLIHDDGNYAVTTGLIFNLDSWPVLRYVKYKLCIRTFLVVENNSLFVGTFVSQAATAIAFWISK